MKKLSNLFLGTLLLAAMILTVSCNKTKDGPIPIDTCSINDHQTGMWVSDPYWANDHLAMTIDTFTVDANGGVVYIHASTDGNSKLTTGSLEWSFIAPDSLNLLTDNTSFADGYILEEVNDFDCDSLTFSGWLSGYSWGTYTTVAGPRVTFKKQ